MLGASGQDASYPGDQSRTGWHMHAASQRAKGPVVVWWWDVVARVWVCAYACALGEVIIYSSPKRGGGKNFFTDQ